ncbi:MAG: hypothetical protein DSY55_03185 [Clostridia bacterium]|nr:MAG: hypothetical protein DSY55_03185 [Clostridia bacterium]
MPTPTETLTPTATSSPSGHTFHESEVRTGPAPTFPVIGVVAADQEVPMEAIDPTGKWVKITVTGADQTWVARSDLFFPEGVTLPVMTDLPFLPLLPTPDDSVRLYETSITIPTYPWKDFLKPVFDKETQWDYTLFDQVAYDASNPHPSPKNYKLINLENRWIHLNVMPELGGRIYELIFKPTGADEFYKNLVIKPSPWGPGPHGNGWLAAGGLEWALPVPEHGYAWSEEWGYITLPGEKKQAVTVFDKHQNTVHLSVTVALQPDKAGFDLHFNLKNRSKRVVALSYWSNAMLAPGPANTLSPDLSFFYPTDKVVVHSTGDKSLPKPGEICSWPNYQGRDMNRLGNWHEWLGFFAFPQAQKDWAAVYDVAANEGIVRIFPHTKVHGLKGFAFGWDNPISPDKYTDDGSAYMEMQGGLAANYDEQFPLAAGEEYDWDEFWYPVAGIHGVTQADQHGAVNLRNENDGLHLYLFSVSPISGDISIRDASGVIYHASIDIAPNSPAGITLPKAQAPISFSLHPADGTVDWKMSGLTP